MDWDDLRYVLAVAESGSLASAGRRLGVNHTTVLRRITSFEERLGLRLFERLPTGYVLTPGGEELIVATREIEDRIAALERKLVGRDLQPAGTIRLTTTDTLMASILPKILADFHATHPEVQLEVTRSNEMLNLSKRDADIAIRPVSDPPEVLVGRRVAGVAFGLYAAQHWAEQYRAAQDLAALSWIGPDDSLAATALAKWMRSELPTVAIALRADSMVAMRDAARAGMGAVALPCYLGVTSGDLTCIRRPVEKMANALWILTHEDLRHTARIRAFTEFAAQALTRLRPLIEGADAI